MNKFVGVRSQLSDIPIDWSTVASKSLSSKKMEEDGSWKPLEKNLRSSGRKFRKEEYASFYHLVGLKKENWMATVASDIWSRLLDRQ